MEEIRLQEIGDIPLHSVGSELRCTSVANDGSLLFFFAEPLHGAEPRRFTLIRETPSGWQDIIELPHIEVTYPLVDVFPDGRILVADSRCGWRSPSDYDLNGMIIDPETQEWSAVLLGDGINRASVDTLGRIWVSYSDEGILGTGAWGRRGATPVGAAGLVCFSESGDKLWEFGGIDANKMVDCYALNVSGSEAFIHFYTDFPICKISGEFEMTSWKTALRGCHEFAVSQSKPRQKVLFSGQYGDDLDVAYFGRLGRSGDFEEVRQARLILPDGSRLDEGKLLGRGACMYFFHPNAVYRTDLNSLD